MSYNESRKNASIKYAKEHVHRIPLDVPNELFEAIKTAAAAAGEPVNTYIKTAIRLRMEKE